jgi:hypothetical protein
VRTPLPIPGHRQRQLITGARVRAVGAAGALFVALVVITRIVFQDPTFIDRFSVENRSGYDIRIDVAGDDGSGSMPLGVAAQRCTTVFDLVIDQGPTWRIRFHSQGVDGGEVTVTRADLQRANWTFQIPDSVETELTRRQAPLPPVHGCASVSPAER